MKTDYLDTRNSKVMIIAPHPDDETIGAGGIIIRTMKNRGDVKVIYITTGISKSKKNSKQILIRENESICAMQLAGVNKDSLFFLQYDSEDLANSRIFYDCIDKISRIINVEKPEFIFIPTYEGGHIDHDITNFIFYKVFLALKLDNIPIFEYPSYTSYLKMDFISMKRILRRLLKSLPLIEYRFPNTFIPHNRGCKMPVITLHMSNEELQLKMEMIKKYVSQNPVDLIFWHGFPDRFKKFSPYDYTKPPHEKNLLGRIIFFIGEKLHRSQPFRYPRDIKTCDITTG